VCDSDSTVDGVTMCVGGDSTAGGDTIYVNGDTCVVGDIEYCPIHILITRANANVWLLLLLLLFRSLCMVLKVTYMKQTVLLGHIAH
jgi:hypothetical protein